MQYLEQTRLFDALWVRIKSCRVQEKLCEELRLKLKTLAGRMKSGGWVNKVGRMKSGGWVKSGGKVIGQKCSRPVILGIYQKRRQTKIFHSKEELKAAKKFLDFLVASIFLWTSYIAHTLNTDSCSIDLEDLDSDDEETVHRIFSLLQTVDT